MRHTEKILASALATILLVACHSPGPPPKVPGADADRVRLHVLVTTDFHGHIAPTEIELRGGDTVLRGGSGIIGGYVANMRRKAPGRVILVDAGDTLTGTMESNRFDGEPVVRVYNLLGYDAMALGNHDFDMGRGVLLERVAEMHFPALDANVVDESTGKVWKARGLASTTMIEREGVGIGIVGLSTPETPSTTNPSNVSGLRFLDPVPVARREAKKLREQGANLVVVILHDGGFCKPGTDVTDTSSCDLKGPIFRLAKGLGPDLADLVVGGHTHSRVVKVVSGVPVVVAGSYGQWIGRVDFTVSRKTGRIMPGETVVHPLRETCHRVFEGTTTCNPKRGKGRLVQATYEGEPVQEDPAVMAAIGPVLKEVAALRSEPLGAVAATPLTKDYHHESELGNLICDALLAAYPQAQVALHNSGGIRAEVDAGPITYGEAYQVLPFGNTVAFMEMKGSQLIDLVRIGTSGEHGMLQVAGIRVVADRAKGDVRVTMADGTPIDPEATYTVVTNSYLASGGSGFDRVVSKLPRGAIQIEGDLLLDVLVRYLRGLGEKGRAVDPPERPLVDLRAPRIEIVGGKGVR